MNIHSPKELLSELIDLDTLKEIQGPWEELAREAIEENPFLAPDVLIPAIQYLAKSTVHIAVVWQEQVTDNGVEERRLVALLPIARMKAQLLIPKGRYGPMPGPLVAWQHHYGVLGMPLIHSEAPQKYTEALFNFIANIKHLPKTIFLPLMPVEQPIWQGIVNMCSVNGWNLAITSKIQRAGLSADQSSEDYISNALSAHRLKRIEQLTKRLRKIHAINYTTVTEPNAVEEAFSEFIKLEKSGWKGKRKTAIGSKENDELFFQIITNKLAQKNKLYIHKLHDGEHVIAISIGVRCEKTFFAFKTTYDESLARFSPGMLLTTEITRQLCDDPMIIKADSLADPNHPMIDFIWKDRLDFANMMITFGNKPIEFAYYRALEGAFLQARKAFHWGRYQWKMRSQAKRKKALKSATK